MQIIDKNGWDDAWVVGNGYIFNENLGLRFTEEDLKRYWIDMQYFNELKKWRNRIIQYKFDFV